MNWEECEMKRRRCGLF